MKVIIVTGGQGLCSWVLQPRNHRKLHSHRIAFDLAGLMVGVGRSKSGVTFWHPPIPSHAHIRLEQCGLGADLLLRFAPTHADLTA